MNEQPQKQKPVVGPTSNVINDERLRPREDLGGGFVFFDPGQRRVQESRLLGGDRAQVRQPVLALEDLAKDAPHGVVHGFGELEVETRIAIDESDAVIAMQAELDLGELGLSPQQRPVDAVGQAIGVRVEKAHTAIERIAVERIAHAVIIEVDVPLHELPVIVAYSEIGNSIAVRITQRERFEPIVIRVQPVELVERVGFGARAQLPEARALFVIWQESGRRARIVQALK